MQPHNFFSTDATPSHSSRKNLILNSKKSPASTQEVSESEVPVHVPLRRPRPFRFERLRVPVWNPYSRGRLSPAKSEDRKGGEGKTDANLTNFLSTCCLAPQLAATPWGGSPPRPLCQKICYSDCTENCPLCPLRAPRRFRNPKIGQQLGAQPTPRFRVMSEAMSEAMSDVEIDGSDRPMAALHFLPPV